MRCIDLFSGIGGFRVGLEQAFPDTIKTIAYCENNERAVESYKAVFNGQSSQFIEDICDATDQSVSIEDFLASAALRRKVAKKVKANFPEAELVVGGFPCQPHSLMGNRKGLNDKQVSCLWNWQTNIFIEAKNFIFENVRAFKSVNGGELTKTFLACWEFRDLQIENYELNATVWNYTNSEAFI